MSRTSENSNQFLAIVESDKFKNGLLSLLETESLQKQFISNIKMEALKNPKIYNCTRESIFQCAMSCAQLKLAPDSLTGTAYLIPYGQNLQFILGYKGLLKLAYRSIPNLEYVSTNSVYQNDKFNIKLGNECILEHEPVLSNRGSFLGVYAIMHMKNGHIFSDWMPKEDIDKLKNRSKAKNSGPWLTDYEAMAKRGPIRRLLKTANINDDLQKAISVDEAHEYESKESSKLSVTSYETKPADPLMLTESKLEFSDVPLGIGTPVSLNIQDTSTPPSMVEMVKKATKDKG